MAGSIEVQAFEEVLAAHLQELKAAIGENGMVPNGLRERISDSVGQLSVKAVEIIDRTTWKIC